MWREGHPNKRRARQRIGIARAIYKGGKILILDEATSALDINTEDSIMEFIKNLNKEYLLIVSHQQNALKFWNN